MTTALWHAYRTSFGSACNTVFVWERLPTWCRIALGAAFVVSGRGGLPDDSSSYGVVSRRQAGVGGRTQHDRHIANGTRIARRAETASQSCRSDHLPTWWRTLCNDGHGRERAQHGTAVTADLREPVGKSVRSAVR